MRRIQASSCFGRTARDGLRCTTSWRRTGTRWCPTWWRPSIRLVMKGTISQRTNRPDYGYYLKLTSNIPIMAPMPLFLFSPAGLWSIEAEASAHLHPRGQPGRLCTHGGQKNHRQHVVSTQAGAGLWKHRHQSAAGRSVRLPGRCEYHPDRWLYEVEKEVSAENLALNIINRL